MVACWDCPRGCGVVRDLELGACRAPGRAVVATAMVHMGEEAIISGSGGSGTVFFSGCNLGCVFCQNHNISQVCRGEKMDAEALANTFLKLEADWVHNINLVSPSHFSAQIAEAIKLAKQKGIKLPFVYNSGGYDSLKTLKEMDGLIDIYMPDLKFADDALGSKYSGVDDYFSVAAPAIAEMARQAGAPVVAGGIMHRGLLVRHLVMPGMVQDSMAALDWLKANAPDAIVNIMDQYRPTYQAHNYPEINRRLDAGEYRQVVEYYEKLEFKYAHLLPQGYMFL